MRIQRVQSNTKFIHNYGVQTKNNNQQKREQSISFTASGNAPAYSKKGCGFFMALSIATVLGTVAAPVMTYNYLSKNEKENGKIVNILTSIGTGVAVFGAGCAGFFHIKD